MSQAIAHDVDYSKSRRSEDFSRISLIIDAWNRDSIQSDRESWFEGLMEAVFKIKERGSTFNMELTYGLIHFISCLYVLPVVPQQLIKAGYDFNSTIVAVSLCSGLGTILSGLITNLPFVLAPPTAVSIFLAVFLRSNDLGPNEGNMAVILSGVIIMFFFFRPLSNFFTRLIPLPIQVGTVVGIGLLTALAGAVEIDLVRTGKYTIVDLGSISSEVLIAMSGVLVIGVAIHYHVKGAFCLALVLCSVLWWAVSDTWPTGVAASPSLSLSSFRGLSSPYFPVLTADLVFLYILYLNGIIRSLSNLAQLQREDGATPRARWLYIFAGAATIASGLVSSAPVLISPESAGAIKSGAKTGLSALVCGLCFVLAAFFGPIFQAVPAAGTAPLLLIVGTFLFQDANRLVWANIDDALPAFAVLFFIPFSYSIIYGVVMGYIIYLVVGICTGVLLDRSLALLTLYLPGLGQSLQGMLETYRKSGRGQSKSQSLSLSLPISPSPRSESSTTESLLGGRVAGGGGIGGGGTFSYGSRDQGLGEEGGDRERERERDRDRDREASVSSYSRAGRGREGQDVEGGEEEEERDKDRDRERGRARSLEFAFHSPIRQPHRSTILQR